MSQPVPLNKLQKCVLFLSGVIAFSVVLTSIIVLFAWRFLPRPELPKPNAYTLREPAPPFYLNAKSDAHAVAAYNAYFGGYQNNINAYKTSVDGYKDAANAYKDVLDAQQKSLTIVYNEVVVQGLMSVLTALFKVVLAFVFGVPVSAAAAAYLQTKQAEVQERIRKSNGGK